MPAVVFLTGSTGFIGTQIARRLIRQTDSKIIVVVRAESKENATMRLKRAWWEWPETYQAIGNHVDVINGDLTKPFFGLETSNYIKLIQNVTHIIHSAANTTPNLPLEELRRINVAGSANILELAKAIKEDHGLNRLSHISTAYVAGKRNGAINENDLSEQSGFSSIYEQTKYESEVLMNNAKCELPISIFRPSLVIGDSKTGAIKTFNTIYYLLKLYLNKHLRVIPTSPQFKINLVPVDYVADAIVNLTFDDTAAGLTFHLTSPLDKTPTVKELVRFVRDWGKQNMGINLPRAWFIPASTHAIQGLLQLQTRLNPSNKKAENAFRILSPYFSQNQDFKRENTNNLIGQYNLNWREILPNILQYAVYYSFFHRSERTVHEQILFRLQSETKPIRFHEIRNGEIVNYDTAQVRKEILLATDALKKMGIKKGDAVAIIGNNSLRYLMADVATGLAGGISCPIYMTSPASEISKILSETNAKLFFVGSPKILQEITAIRTDIPIISLHNQTAAEKFKGVISWSKFIENATNLVSSVTAPVEFQDLATVRYTYGSTGEPKGACLEHGSLLYVAEALASNFPWKTRNTKAAYLSFLPMNHVAEGITAMYSPYFVPAALNIYFLDNYRNLQEALQKAKPNVFFAIPRFYEKIWDNLTADPFGQQYIKANNPLKKRLLRQIVRFSMLKKTGLNKCSQLIVGAACSSETLLRNFQNLGIEVHNAYGLSEAPLVAMNRLGSNNPATVGPPLRNTELQIDQDGEVLIRGPQVMRNYLNRGNNLSFKEGWFATGDLGQITVEGHLKILGRKKNVIVTAYGKKVPVEGIESTLKNIDNVIECLVVGDDRPYCIAALWVDKQSIDCEMQIKAAIEKLNEKLEAPAQIKRYIILEGNTLLDQKKTEAQLKTKRQELLKQFKTEIETVYISASPNEPSSTKEK